jgi:hypothetical protein
MAEDATLTSHFSVMCRYYRELELHGQPLTDRQKITKTMCKMNLKWYELTNAWVVTQPEDLSFDNFRTRILRMEVDKRTFQVQPHSQAAFATSSRQQGQHHSDSANFHHSTGSRGRTSNNNRGRAQGRAGRAVGGRGGFIATTTTVIKGPMV